MKHWIVFRTGQGSKLMVGAGLLAVGGLLNLLAILYSGSQSFDASSWLARLQFPAAILALAGLFYMCASVRCPNCGARWIWMAVSGKLERRSPGALLDLDRCPSCGYSGSDDLSVGQHRR